MKISDEIRDWVNKPEPKLKPLLKLLDLADRIDCEMVELPCDKDGEPIHVGDTVWECASGTEMTIKELRMTSEKGWVIPVGCGLFYSVLEVTHTRPDSLERIADDIEAAEDWCDREGEYGTGITSVRESTLREWADRIRKLARKDGE